MKYDQFYRKKYHVKRPRTKEEKRNFLKLGASSLLFMLLGAGTALLIHCFL